MPDFCSINANYDSNIVSGVSFSSGTTYVLRFVLDGWEAQTPPAHKLLELAKAVAGTLAAANYLGLYNIKAVVLRKAASGEAVPYYVNHWYTVALGSGCNEKLIAGDGTWVVDLVFQAAQDEVTTGKPWASDDSVLIKYLRGALAGTRGTPQVFVGGIVPLVPGQGSGSAASEYEAAANYWASKQSYWQFTRKTSETSTGYSWDMMRVNYAAPGTAWASVPYIGDGGVGICLGDAFDPSKLQPLATEGTIQGGGGAGANTVWNTINPTGSGQLTREQKALGVGAGLLFGWLIGKRLFNW